jgi:hypothetical protein
VIRVCCAHARSIIDNGFVHWHSMVHTCMESAWAWLMTCLYWLINDWLKFSYIIIIYMHDWVTKALISLFFDWLQGSFGYFGWFFDWMHAWGVDWFIICLDNCLMFRIVYDSLEWLISDWLLGTWSFNAMYMHGTLLIHVNRYKDSAANFCLRDCIQPVGVDHVIWSRLIVSS